MTVESLMGDVDVGGGPLDVPMVLENMNVLMQQLTDAFDYAVPAFPPKYRIFESVMAPAWHRSVGGGCRGRAVGVARNPKGGINPASLRACGAAYCDEDRGTAAARENWTRKKRI
jgi:hypothetical protein